MTNSDHYPVPERLQGSIIIPYNIKQVEQDGKTSYNYDEHRISDIGQPFGETEHRQALQELLQKAHRDYLDSRYDLYVREALQAVFADPMADGETKATAMSVWGWIRVVTGYYYQQAALLHGAGFESASWDFSQFDESDPKVALHELMTT